MGREKEVAVAAQLAAARVLARQGAPLDEAELALCAMEALRLIQLVEEHCMGSGLPVFQENLDKQRARVVAAQGQHILSDSLPMPGSSSRQRL